MESTRQADADLTRVDEFEYCPRGDRLENQLAAGGGGFVYDYNLR
ncbi:MAG TPA: hypothetical protein VLA93_03490 [Pyrinomonadaceae bacterium]|nr:hypothetical protein [Pyrinomonadaceae bacterium]